MAENNARSASIGHSPRGMAERRGTPRGQGLQHSQAREERGSQEKGIEIPGGTRAVGEERSPQAKIRSRADQVMASDDMSILVNLVSVMAECLKRSAAAKEEEQTMKDMRALTAAVAESQAHARSLSAQHQWPIPVRDEVIHRLGAMARDAQRQGANLIATQVPQSWKDRCDILKAKAEAVITQATPHLTVRDWSLQDCQDYLVELEAKVNGAIMAMRLNYNNPNEGSLDMGVLLLTSEAREARDTVLELRQRHIEKLRESSAMLPAAPRQEQSYAGKVKGESPARYAAPANVGMATALGAAGGGVRTPHPDLCPWFYGSARDLVGFKEAWADYAQRYLTGFAEEELIDVLRGRCMPECVRVVVKEARSVIEIWSQLQDHFQRQEAHLRNIVTRLLMTTRPVDENQFLAYYRRVMIALQESDEIGKT